MSALVPLMVLVPLLAAAAALITGPYPRAQVAISTGGLSVTTAISAILLVQADRDGATVIEVGDWPAPWGIVLVVDRFSAIMLLVSSVVLLSVLVYAVGQGIADGNRETPVTIFHPTYLMLAAGIYVAFITGDLFNLYVGFEILLGSSYVLLTLAGTGARIRAGTTYIVTSLVSSAFFLAAIAMVYAATGTVNMAQVAERIGDLPDTTATLLHVMLLLGFSIKAALFPMSFWLPDSYPTAPAPVTAVFAGLLTKVGVYAIIRTETLLFPDDGPGGDFRVPMMWVALLTMVVGILGAAVQADIKRLLSFTLVSHIGYMIFGVALSSPLGLNATVYYVVHHITVQTTLFLAVGLVERIGGTTSISRLSGLLKRAPLIAVLFFIPALNLGGIPPFSGFLGKAGLLIAGAQQGGWVVWVLIVGSVLTSLLTLYALMRVWNMAFWRSRAEVEAGYRSTYINTLVESPDDEGEVRTGASTPRLMVAATTGMVIVTLALTALAGPLFALGDRTATEIADRDAVITAVLHSGGADG
nr:MAG: Na+/H+ antiporter subunit D [Actinomycetota bacterium]